MQNKKLKFTVVGIVFYAIIMIFFFVMGFITKSLDVAIWALWFGGFDLLIGVFAKFNADDKKIRMQFNGAKTEEIIE